MSCDWQSVEIEINLSAVSCTEAAALESWVKVDVELELTDISNSERSSWEHGERWIKTPCQILNFDWEVCSEVIDGFSCSEGVGTVLVWIGNNISHSESKNGSSWEIDEPKDDDLTVGRKLCESSDDPWVGILNDATNLSLNIDWRFSSVIAIESWSHCDCWSTMLFDSWYSCWIVRELYLNATSFGY